MDFQADGYKKTVAAEMVQKLASAKRARVDGEEACERPEQGKLVDGVKPFCMHLHLHPGKGSVKGYQ